MANVLDDILATTRYTQWASEALAVIDGLRAMLRLCGADAANASPALADYLIALIDGKISEQVNAVMHHPDFMALEATWRGLRFLVDRLDFSQNIQLEYINVSKDNLLRDFQDSPAAGKEFFGLDEWRGLPDIKDLPGIFDSPRYERWKSFRENPNARYVGLTLPGILLRLPYGEDGAPPAASFNFTEELSGEDTFCWGNPAFALAARLGDSFAKYRWCVNIIGPDGGGRVEDLPFSRHEAMWGIQDKIPTRIRAGRTRVHPARHRPDAARGGFLFRQLRSQAQNIPQNTRGRFSGNQFPPVHAIPLHDAHEQACPLHQNSAKGKHGVLAGKRRTDARTEQMDQPIRHGHGHAGRAYPKPQTLADGPHRC